MTTSEITTISTTTISTTTITTNCQINHYTAKKLLAHGTFGVVWEATSEITQRSYALKTIKYNLTLNEEKKAIEKLIFFREGKILKKLNEIYTKDIGKRFIVKHYENSHESDPIPYIVMELCGHNLLQYTQIQKKAISFKTIRWIGVQIFSALRYLHNVGGLIHADLKPENILIALADCNGKEPSSMPQIKLTDFGNSITINDLTIYNHHYHDYEIQSRPYRAPEIVFANKNSVSSAIDMWSVGCMLCELYAINLNNEYRFKRLFPCRNKKSYTDLVFNIGNTLSSFPIYIYNEINSQHHQKILDVNYLYHLHHDKISYMKLKRYRKAKLLEIFTIGSKIPTADKIHGADLISFADLISCLLDLNPATRYTATDSIEHEFMCSDFVSNNVNKANNKKVKPSKEDNMIRQKKINQQVTKYLLKE